MGWICEGCGEKFEVPAVAGEGCGSHWYACPNCGCCDTITEEGLDEDDSPWDDPEWDELLEGVDPCDEP
jgi:hypothetical protein